MNLFQWLLGSRRERPQVETERLICRVLKSFALPTLETEPGLWSVVAERRDTYRVSLFLWAVDAKLHCMAGCEIAMERELVPRELMLQLLEENHRCEDSSFRLVTREDQRRVVLGRVIDTRWFPESELPHLGETLIERLQRMVTKLYGMGLIISGPEANEKNQNQPR